MSYQRLIIEIVGCGLEDALEIEELMRTEYSTLDHLGYSEFVALALDAFEAVRQGMDND